MFTATEEKKPLPVTFSKTTDRLAERKCHPCSFFIHENKHLLLYKITIFRVSHLFTIMLAHSIFLKFCKIDIFGTFSFIQFFFVGFFFCLFPFPIYIIYLFFSFWSYIYFKDIFSKNNFSQHNLSPSCKSFAHIYLPQER